MTRILQDDGRLRTFWFSDNPNDTASDWVNCQVASVHALRNLAAAMKAAR